jgi:Na+/melibiose symporter-like transporter
MNARRRRALATGVGALLVAVLCAALSTNVEGGQRTVLIMVTVAWLVIAAVSVANALRTARPTAEQVPTGTPGADDDPA